MVRFVRVTVTTVDPAKIRADVVIQLFGELSAKIPLAGHLARNARELINTEMGGLTWLEGRRMVAADPVLALQPRDQACFVGDA